MKGKRPEVIIQFEKKTDLMVRRAKNYLIQHRHEILNQAMRRFGVATVQSIAVVTFPQIGPVIGATTLTPTQKQFVETLIRQLFKV